MKIKVWKKFMIHGACKIFKSFAIYSMKATTSMFRTVLTSPMPSGGDEQLVDYPVPDAR